MRCGTAIIRVRDYLLSGFIGGPIGAIALDVESLVTDNEANIFTFVIDDELAAIVEVEGKGAGAEVFAGDILQSNSGEIDNVAVMDAFDCIIAVAVGVEEEVLTHKG